MEQKNTHYVVWDDVLWTNAPTGWLRRSIPVLQEFLTARSDVLQLESSTVPPSPELRALHLQRVNEELQRFLEDKWLRITGRRAEESAFTLAMPIHNEQKHLLSVLNVVLSAHIPKRTPVQVVLVTNACTDASQEILGHWLGRLDGFERSRYEGPVVDNGLDSEIMKARCGSVEFIALNTRTAGKANALTIANSLAVRRGDPICMSLDANNWVEPDSVACLYRDARASFEKNCAVVSGHSIFVYSTGGRNFYNRVRDHALRVSPVPDHAGVVNGQIMSWNPQWLLAAVGSFPSTATEDYALGVHARADGKEVVRSKEAVTWSYGATSLWEAFKLRSRYDRGKFQINDVFAHRPDVQAFLAEESNSLKPAHGRIKVLFDAVKTAPLYTPLHLFRFAFGEIARARGLKDYRRDPKSSTWEAIKSTKG